MGSDEDEETRRWEEEQILKGVKASAPEQLTSANPAPPHLSMLDQSFLVGTGGYGDVGTSYMTPSYVPAVQAYAGITPQGVAETLPTGGGGGGSKNSFRIPEKLVPITVESLKSRLTNRLRDLQDSVSEHRERLEQIRTDLERSREEVGVAESQRGDLGLRYQFFQEMRGYLRDLLACLGEKVSTHSFSMAYWCALKINFHVFKFFSKKIDFQNFYLVNFCLCLHDHVATRNLRY